MQLTMRYARIILAILLALAAASFPDHPDQAAGVGLFVLIGVLWLTEALPLTYTALLVPLAGVALGLTNLTDALKNFAHPIIGLFLGGFALAAALSQHGIDRWLAHRLLQLARGRPLAAAGLLSATTAFLSMWISNTATTAMMLPIALGLVAPLGDRFPQFRLFMLLALAWSANIGGIATLVGSPPNAITAAALGWGFNDWMKVGMPLFLVLFPLALLLLFWLIKPERDVPRVEGSAQVAFPQHPAAWSTVLIFLLTVVLWIGGKPVAHWLGIDRDFDTWVALLAIGLLGITGSVSWRQVEHQANWGVLLLFGGGITLSALMQSSGASSWLAHGMSNGLPHDQPWLLYIIITLFVIFLTELVSNTASAALLVPMLMPVAAAVGANDQTTAVLIGVAASCAFMLPVATPPNALVYGSGYVPQHAMMRAGAVLNVLAAVLIAVLVPWLQ